MCIRDRTVLVRGATTAQIAHENQAHAQEIAPDASIADLAALPEIVAAWT